MHINAGWLGKRVSHMAWKTTAEPLLNIFKRFYGMEPMGKLANPLFLKEKILIRNLTEFWNTWDRFLQQLKPTEAGSLLTAASGETLLACLIFIVKTYCFLTIWKRKLTCPYFLFQRREFLRLSMVNLGEQVTSEVEKVLGRISVLRRVFLWERIEIKG